MSHLLKINQTMAETAVLMRLIIETLSGPGALRYVRDKQKTLNSIIFFIADFALLHWLKMPFHGLLPTKSLLLTMNLFFF